MTTKYKRWRGRAWMYLDYPGHSVSHPVADYREGDGPWEFEWVEEDGRCLLVHDWSQVIAVRFEKRPALSETVDS